MLFGLWRPKKITETTLLPPIITHTQEQQEQMQSEFKLEREDRGEVKTKERLKILLLIVCLLVFSGIISGIDFAIKSYVDKNPPIIGVEILGPEKINGIVQVIGGKWKYSGAETLFMRFPIELRMERSANWPDFKYERISIEFKDGNETLGTEHIGTGILNQDVNNFNLVADLRNEMNFAREAATCQGRRVEVGASRVPAAPAHSCKMLLDFLRPKKTPKASLLPVSTSTQTKPEPKPKPEVKYITNYVYSSERKDVNSPGITNVLCYFCFMAMICLFLGYVMLARLSTSNNPLFASVDLLGPEEINGSIGISSGFWKHSGEPYLHMYFPIELHLNKSSYWSNVELPYFNATFKNGDEPLGTKSVEVLELTDDLTILTLIVEFHSTKETALMCTDSTNNQPLLISMTVESEVPHWGVRTFDTFEKTFSVNCHSGHKFGSSI